MEWWEMELPFFCIWFFQWNNKVIKWETGNRSGVRDLRTEWRKCELTVKKSGKVSWTGKVIGWMGSTKDLFTFHHEFRVNFYATSDFPSHVELFKWRNRECRLETVWHCSNATISQRIPKTAGPHKKLEKVMNRSLSEASEWTSSEILVPWTSGFQKINFCSFKLASLWYFATAALKTNEDGKHRHQRIPHVFGLDCSPNICIFTGIKHCPSGLPGGQWLSQCMGDMGSLPGLGGPHTPWSN